MNVSMGIAPLDERIGGVRTDGLYLLTGGADTAKLAFQLQFVAEGLRNGKRAAVLSAAAPADLLEQAEYLGFDLTSYWHNGSCILLGFKGDYARRVVHAPNPTEAFAELSDMLQPSVDRLAIDPGSFLWSTRAGTSMAQTFGRWAEANGSIVVASVAAGLDERPDPATEWLLQRATGVFHFARGSTGVHEVAIQRLSPPVDTSGPVSLELVAGKGLCAPSGQIERRRTDRDRANRDRVLLLRLGTDFPADLEEWISSGREAVEASDGMDLLQRLQSGGWGLVCVYADGARAAEAIEVIRTARATTSGAILLLSDTRLRSGDRALALDAGADDVLSHGIHLKELDARIRRALDSTRPTAAVRTDGSEPAAVEHLLEQAEFGALFRERSGSGELGHFSVIDASLPGVPDLGEILLASIRAESGDLVGALNDGFCVLLQDARVAQAEAFLERVRQELTRRGVDSELRAEILASPEDSQRIRELLGA